MSEDCRLLIQRAEDGQLELHTSLLVIAEVIWTLRSRYRIPRAEVVALVRDLMGLRSLRVEQRELLDAAIDRYAATNVDFADAYNAVDLRQRGFDRIVSYDKDFDRLGVPRVEPADVLRSRRSRGKFFSPRQGSRPQNGCRRSSCGLLAAFETC